MKPLGTKLAQILDANEHHKRMRKLKQELGEPRPGESFELSLINPESPDVYEGRTGNGRPCLLSIDPADYAWETRTQNNRRKQEYSESDYWDIAWQREGETYLDQDYRDNYYRLPLEDDYSEDSYP